MRSISLVCLFTVSLAGGACAFSTYNGTDFGVGPGGASPNSNAAAWAFDAATASLGPAKLVSFEDLPVTYNQTFDAAPGIHVTLNGLDYSVSGIATAADVETGYNTTLGGSKFLKVGPLFDVGTTSVAFTFDTPVQAWGAYLTGVGTANGNLHVLFHDGSSQDLPVVGSPFGGVQFVGFSSPGNAIASVTLSQNGVQGSRDIYGVDDVRAVAVPEPITLSLLALGGLLITRCRRV